MEDRGDRDRVDHNQVAPPDGRNYKRYAILALILYFALWAPGFIVNMVFLAQALGEERRTGRTPEGKTELLLLLGAGLIVPVLGMCVLTVLSLEATG